MTVVSNVSVLTQAVIVDSVMQTVITDIVQDPDTAEFVREIRVYAGVGSTTDQPPTFTLRLTSTVQANIELTAPAVQF